MSRLINVSPRRKSSSRWLAVVALVLVLAAWLAAVSMSAAGRDPLPPVSLPLSTECHDAVRTYMEERQWSLDHFDQDLPVSLFKQHRIWMADAWQVAEIECGIDIDQDGRLG